MIKLTVIGVALVLSIVGAQVYAQTDTTSPTEEVTTTATPTPTGSVQGDSDVTVPEGAPSTGFGGSN